MTIEEHYSDLLKKYGDDPRAVQLSDRTTQRRRFRVLIDPFERRGGGRILDVGCGLAHLLEYLQENGVDCEYTGVDANQDMVDASKEKFPSCHFERLDIGRQAPDWDADLVLCSGLFNNRREDPQAFLRAALRNMYSVTRRVLAFNLMSSYVDFIDSDLDYFDPEDVFRFCKEHLGPLVSLRHDYEVKPGIVPFEFAVHVYRGGGACRRRICEGVARNVAGAA